jgi:microcystin-dependent protein
MTDRYLFPVGGDAESVRVQIGAVGPTPDPTLSPPNVGDHLTWNGSAWLPGEPAPAGSLVMFAGATAPYGYLLCDGAAVSRTTYAALFSVIGTTYGVGDNATTFNIPDLRGRVPLGVGTGAGLTPRVLATTGGAESVTLDATQIPGHTHTGTTDSAGAHTHGITDPGHTHTQTTINDDFNNSGTNPPGFSADSAGSRTWSNINSSATGISVNSDGAHTHTFTTGSTGGGGSHANMQPWIALNYIIKT